ncbi:DUF2332 domain-containing protein [Micrococcales bacterium 31B]|nr:DUF2332 domain-containing protein [Micrococcales bacterium 31B]
MDWKNIRQLLREQSDTCARLGSPIYSGILRRLALDTADAPVDEQSVTADPVLRVLGPHRAAVASEMIPLRLLAAVHRIVLAGNAPDLARFFPSMGGDLYAGGGPMECWQAFVDVLKHRFDEVRAGLEYFPQTNETGRGAPLIGGLLHAIDQLGLAGVQNPVPVRFNEIGASGGLNLRCDRFRYLSGDEDSAGWGPTSTCVTFTEAWLGEQPPGGDGSVRLDVRSRQGADINPVDLTTEAGQQHLMSFIWPDHVLRQGRLRCALDIARVMPVEIHRESAIDFVNRLELTEGELTVLWHSVMWQYVTPAEQQQVQKRIEELGAQATQSKPFTHISFEPAPHLEDRAASQVLVVRVWPSVRVGNMKMPAGVPQLLAKGTSHGIPVQWK